MNNKCLGAVLACLLTLATFAGFAVWNSHAPMAQDDFYFTTMVPGYGGFHLLRGAPDRVFRRRAG